MQIGPLVQHGRYGPKIHTLEKDRIVHILEFEATERITCGTLLKNANRNALTNQLVNVIWFLDTVNL